MFSRVSCLAGIRHVGQTTTAQATVRDASGNVLSGQTVSWGSTASGIASASSTGALTAQVSGVSAGQANITATTTNNITASAPITVQNPPPPPPPLSNLSVSTVGINPALTIARDLCLTVSLGSGAASECGDLRLVHALPTTRTLTAARTPTLVYSSAHAHPFPVVAVNVTLASGVTRPDSVEAILRVNGVEKKRAKWMGTDLTPGGTSRIAIGYDALNDATGIYSYTVEAVPYYGGAAATPATGSGQLVIVNRSQSAFGAGWWLAGLEQFFAQGDGSKLWVGGDGSTRRYASVGNNKYVAESVDFPDTLVFDGASTYTRLAPNGLKVQFNSSGNHTATVNRLGHTTSFTYVVGGTTPRLGASTLPPSGSGLSYTFAYDANNHLATVTAPPIGATTRVTTITIASNGQLESITDPDTKVVSFGYDATFFRRATSRTDRRLNTTSFTYDGGWKARQSTLPMGGSQPSIVMTVRALETVGIHPATGQGRMIDTASAYALIDGPRTDVADTTMLWLDRWDAPRQIRDALGNVTLIERTNATLPALVTRVKRPNNHVMRAVHDARGHVTLATDSGGVVAGRPDSTRYVWNNTWDVVERIVPQEKDSTVFGIDAANGNRLWQQDARGTSSRVNFTYHAATGLLATVQRPGASGVDSLVYDARGNLSRTRSPLGFVTEHFTDAVGRDTLVTSPIAGGAAKKHRVVYDVVDQVAREETIGPALGYTLRSVTADTAAVRPDTLVATYLYDDEGNRTGVSSFATGSKSDVATSEESTYDNANRLLTKSVGSGPRALSYDAAGNATSVLYATGKTVTQQFDALNRLTLRAVPAQSYPRRRCQGFPVGPISDPAPNAGLACQLVFPYYPNAGDSLVVPADTSTFTFDAVGNTHKTCCRSPSHLS